MLVFRIYWQVWVLQKGGAFDVSLVKEWYVWLRLEQERRRMSNQWRPYASDFEYLNCTSVFILWVFPLNSSLLSRQQCPRIRSMLTKSEIDKLAAAWKKLDEDLHTSSQMFFDSTNIGVGLVSSKKNAQVILT